MSKAFVIAACGTVDEPMIEMLAAGPEGEKFLRTRFDNVRKHSREDGARRTVSDAGNFDSCVFLKQ